MQTNGTPGDLQPRHTNIDHRVYKTAMASTVNSLSPILELHLRSVFVPNFRQHCRQCDVTDVTIKARLYRKQQTRFL
ncbi:hypothetical protein DPMN_141449 [Dreissena polymorpha]|uniref:Uncharacterized protein n=1 Tax=Dreissena polymorpha TaxID=45954 RepID=A0A9D4JL99_DREPO|nr:hypothetical protein DPMN_141449 [Dreissena polymorpha]